jgi:hypothetical protein
MKKLLIGAAFIAAMGLFATANAQAPVKKATKTEQGVSKADKAKPACQPAAAKDNGKMAPCKDVKNNKGAKPCKCGKDAKCAKAPMGAKGCKQGACKCDKKAKFDKKCCAKPMKQAPKPEAKQPVKKDAPKK